MRNSRCSMVFYSILFETAEDKDKGGTDGIPQFVLDLHLDKIIDAITAGMEQYGLTPFFSFPLHSINAITYRQEIMSDLENPDLFSSITSFANSMGATYVAMNAAGLSSASLLGCNGNAGSLFAGSTTRPTCLALCSSLESRCFSSNFEIGSSLDGSRLRQEWFLP